MSNNNHGLTPEEVLVLQGCYKHLDEDQLGQLETEAHEIVMSEINSSEAAEVAFPLLLKSMRHQMAVGGTKKQ